MASAPALAFVTDHHGYLYPRFGMFAKSIDDHLGVRPGAGNKDGKAEGHTIELVEATR
jgi:hypothetical protein